MTFVLASLVVLGTLLLPPSVDAQVRVVRHGDDRLAGITELDVVVSVDPATADACAPSIEPLQVIARDTLRAGGMKATISDKGSSWFYSVLLQLHSAGVEGSCVTSISTAVVAEVQAMPEADRVAPTGSWGSLLVGYMPLITTHELVTSSRREHDASVREAVRARVTAITSRLRAANH